jgi:hypothetical protein
MEACVATGVTVRSPLASVAYRAFVDPSGGSSDAMTLAIAHIEERRVVLDCLLERKAPFSPEAAVAEFAGTLKAYRCSAVTGDRYAGEWPRERFRVHGISYEPAEQNRSELYLAFLPILNSGRLELLDHPRMVSQFCGLERRTARSGKDTVDHAPGAHDDLANAVAGAASLMGSAPIVLNITRETVDAFAKGMAEIGRRNRAGALRSFGRGGANVFCRWE